MQTINVGIFVLFVFVIAFEAAPVPAWPSVWLDGKISPLILTFRKAPHMNLNDGGPKPTRYLNDKLLQLNDDQPEHSNDKVSDLQSKEVIFDEDGVKLVKNFRKAAQDNLDDEGPKPTRNLNGDMLKISDEKENSKSEGTKLVYRGERFDEDGVKLIKNFHKASWYDMDNEGSKPTRYLNSDLLENIDEKEESKNEVRKVVFRDERYNEDGAKLIKDYRKAPQGNVNGESPKPTRYLNGHLLKMIDESEKSNDEARKFVSRRERSNKGGEEWIENYSRKGKRSKLIQN